MSTDPRHPSTLDYHKPDSTARKPFYVLLHPLLWTLLSILLMSIPILLGGGLWVPSSGFEAGLIMALLASAGLASISAILASYRRSSHTMDWRDPFYLLCAIANVLLLLFVLLCIVLIGISAL